MPPFTGVVVNKTVVPEQMVSVTFLEIVTEGTSVGDIRTVMALLSTGVLVAQTELLTNEQVIISLLSKLLLVYVLPVPTFVPFRFH